MKMKRIKICDVSEQIRGVSYKPTDIHAELNENSVILLRANNISDGKINFDSNKNSCVIGGSDAGCEDSAKDLSSTVGQKIISLEESLEIIKDWKMCQLDTETSGRDAHVNDLLCVQIGNVEGTTQIVIDTSTP